VLYLFTGKQVLQAVPCSSFLGEAEMKSYQDENAPKFITGVSLNIIMGSTPRTAAKTTAKTRDAYHFSIYIVPRRTTASTLRNAFCAQRINHI